MQDDKDISGWSNIDYETVARELRRVVALERSWSKELLLHAAKAVEEVGQLREENAALRAARDGVREAPEPARAE